LNPRAGRFFTGLDKTAQTCYTGLSVKTEDVGTFAVPVVAVETGCPPLSKQATGYPQIKGTTGMAEENLARLEKRLMTLEWSGKT